MPTTPEKIIVITKKTPLEDLIQRMNSRAQAKFYLEQNQISFSEYDAAHAQYQCAMESIQGQLPRGVKQQFVDRSFLPMYQFGERDLVVTVGPDGLVVNTAKYLGVQPILAINPDPARIDGVLLPFTFQDFRPWLDRALEGHAPVRRLSMAQAALSDGQVLYALNDLFIGPRTHVSARYHLEVAGRAEQQSSSGIIVSTGAGCTGWLRSITAGAWRVAQYFGELPDDLPDAGALSLGWDSDRLWYTVREPFVSKTSQANIVFGQLRPGQALVITSQMPDYGTIFSDGIESDYLAFNSGAVARVEVADRQAHLIVRV